MTVRRIVSHTAFPALLFGGLFASWALMTLGFGPVFAVFAVVLCAALPLLLLQQWLPFEEEWRGRPSDFGIDLLHMAGTGLTGDVWRAISFGLSYQVAAWLAMAVGATLWPTEWPLLAQFALALVVGDFGAYWVHRLCHTTPMLWRIHAMHHSSERLYVFSATRTHPANVILAWGAQALPLILLGAPEMVLMLMSVFTALHGMLQHANVDFRHGLFNHIFATADLHRWHHSAVMEESNTNFGSNIILWDWIFSTRVLPTDRRHPDQMGLIGIDIPENWFSHLASPFVLDRYTTDDPDDLPELDDFTLESEGSVFDRPEEGADLFDHQPPV